MKYADEASGREDDEYKCAPQFFFNPFILLIIILKNEEKDSDTEGQTNRVRDWKGVLLV